MINILTYIIAIDAFLGGGGGYYTILGFPARFFLLFISILIIILKGLRLTRNPKVPGLVFTGCIFSLLLLYFINATVFQGFNVVNLTDLRQLAYLVVAPVALYNVYSTPKRYFILLKILVALSFINATVHILLTYLLHAGILPFEVLAKISISSGELFFRGVTFFFYKSSAFIPISIFTIYLLPKTKPTFINDWLLYSILIISMVLTLAKGLILSFALCFLLILILKKDKLIFIYAICLASFVVYTFTIRFNLFAFYATSTLSGDELRIKNIFDVLNAINPISLFFGHGFGALVGGERLMIENSFLMIFFKSGLLGFILLLLPLIFSLRQLMSFDQLNPVYQVLCFGTVYFYLLSIFNPFVTNSIGFFWIFITLSSARVFKSKYLNYVK